MDEKSVTYSGRRVSIGIDVHRSFFVMSAVSGGTLLKRCRIPSRGEAVVSFIRKNFPEAEVRTCYEAGYSGFWLHRYLAGAGIENIVVHAASIEVEAGNRIKTDKRDSLKLAEQLDANRLRGIHVPSEAAEKRRVLSRTREQLGRAKRRAQMQIRMRLHQFGLLPESHAGVLRPAMVREVAAQEIGLELRLALEVMLSQWASLELEMKRIDRALLAQASVDKNEAIYRSVPGVGPLLARVLSNELGDMSQFPNERALFGFLGLTPGEYSTGGKAHRGHISRQGSGRLRHALVEASWKAIGKDKKLREDFERIAARRGKRIAIVAVARKLAGRIRASFRAARSYEIGHKLAA